MPDEPEIQLSEEDIEYLVSVLRSASTVTTTEELIEALRANAS
jgi:hypothetical protein